MVAVSKYPVITNFLNYLVFVHFQEFKIYFDAIEKKHVFAKFNLQLHTAHKKRSTSLYIDKLPPNHTDNRIVCFTQFIYAMIIFSVVTKKIHKTEIVMECTNYLFST